MTTNTGDAADQAALIRSLNDRFRRSFVGGRVLMTPGVTALAGIEKLTLMAAVQRFDAFDTGNDPYGEHDFGSVTVAGTCFFWKIDCYDKDLEFGSPDPSDDDVTCRVLTLMRADEY
ncbi:DUF3768 domain-containing protein [Rhizobium sp. PAMB 3182]